MGEKPPDHCSMFSPFGDPVQEICGILFNAPCGYSLQYSLDGYKFRHEIRGNKAYDD